MLQIYSFLDSFLQLLFIIVNVRAASEATASLGVGREYLAPGLLWNSAATNNPPVGYCAGNNLRYTHIPPDTISDTRRKLLYNVVNLPVTGIMFQPSRRILERERETKLKRASLSLFSKHYHACWLLLLVRQFKIPKTIEKSKFLSRLDLRLLNMHKV